MAMPSDSIVNVDEDARDAGLRPENAVRPSQGEDAHNSVTSTTATHRKTPAHNGDPVAKTDSKGTKSWFSIPTPLKRVFDQFPLIVYAENAPPIRARRQGAPNVLYIFTTEEDARSGRASFNPSCLKWQTYLKIAGLRFVTRPSNNHASPSGALPFLLPSPSKSARSDDVAQAPEIIPGQKIKRWTKEQTAAIEVHEPSDIRYEAFASLLDHRIRKAWLLQLYLNPANVSVVKRLYTEPCSSNPVVQMTIAAQLHAAAETEIIKASPRSSSAVKIEEGGIMRDADDAFAALSALLGDGRWFFSTSNEDGPGLFDASVFAYTHLILDSDRTAHTLLMDWKENPLKELLLKYGNLVSHRDRVAEVYF